MEHGVFAQDVTGTVTNVVELLAYLSVWDMPILVGIMDSSMCSSMQSTNNRPSCLQEVCSLFPRHLKNKPLADFRNR